MSLSNCSLDRQSSIAYQAPKTVELGNMSSYECSDFDRLKMEYMAV